MEHIEPGFDTTKEQDMALICYERARAWQKSFDELTDQTHIEELREKAIQDLDSKFPYMGKHVFMSGYGLHIIQDNETGELDEA